VIDLWTTLIPLIVASAVLPLQITVTILLLRSEGGRLRAGAWVAGMTAVRLAQGVLFGLVLGGAVAAGGDSEGPGPVAATLLLVVGVLFLVTAVRKLLDQPDEDAPPPRWMAAAGSMTPGRAFLLGAGIIAISAKLWVFTLGAIGAIAEADLAQPAAVATYLVFVLGAASVHLAAIGVTVVAPARAGALLDRASTLLERHGRTITIGLGLVFGTWFIVRALDGFGIL
jgi:Sap, sulfolipid-1-addressing protein